MPRRVFGLVVVFASVSGWLAAPGATLADPKPEDSVIVRKGTLPVIVSAPHGGRTKVPGVPERLGVGVAQFATGLDSFTAELADLFAGELEKKLGGKPWVVIARFERKFIDANRPPAGAYESDAAKPYYDAYHGPLEAACKAVKDTHGRGLLLDIHGQGTYPDTICRGTQNGKSIKLLKERYGWAAVTGKRSVLGQMERGGYKVLPKCDADESTKEDPKYVGGYMVQTYGSHTGYAIDAIQFEFGTRLRDRDLYPKTAKDLADAVAVFHDAFLKD